MSRVSSALAFGVAVMSLASAAGPPAVDPGRVPAQSQAEDLVAWNELAPYLHVVADYRAGRTAQALSEIRFWNYYELGTAYERLVRLKHRIRLCRETTSESDRRASAGEIEVADLDAAVLLHTDAMLDGLEERAPYLISAQLSAAVQFFEFTREWTDGWSRAPHALPQGCRPPPALSPRDWYLALTWTLLSYWKTNLADTMAGRGLERAPRDAEMLLAAATVKEALAVDALQYGDRRPPRPDLPRELQGRDPPLNAVGHLGEALALYRRALGVQPVYVQTRLRFAWVLSQLGQIDEARAELELAAAGAEDASERYLSELFLARVAEQAGDGETAIRHYRQAIEARPDSQAARIGLVHAIGRSDDGARVPPQLGELLAQPWPRSVSSDPWWRYPFGDSERGVRLLDALRRRLVGTP